MRESEARLSLAAASADAGLWELDLETRHFWVTDKARDLFGIPPDSELTLDTFLTFVHPEDRERIHQTVEQATRSEEGTRVEYRSIHPDGSSVRWMASSGRRHPDSSSKPGRLMGATIDITGRKQMEAETRRLRTQLWHADRVARTGTLTASLAHELNQPLAAILSNAQAGLRFLARDNPDLEEIRAILSDIVRDDKRAGAVISGLRSMLKRQESERVTVDLAETILEMLELLNSELLTHQVELGTDFEAGCTVLADKAQLQQVVLNLTMNAIEAMREQPAAERRLALAVSRTGEGQVQVAVRDAGAGIPAERLATVFDAFWTTKTQGMGLGLAICRSIVESHAGAIWVEANPDRGVTFFFRLPAERTEGLGDGVAGPGEDRG